MHPIRQKDISKLLKIATPIAGVVAVREAVKVATTPLRPHGLLTLPFHMALGGAALTIAVLGAKRACTEARNARIRQAIGPHGKSPGPDPD